MAKYEVITANGCKFVFSGPRDATTDAVRELFVSAHPYLTTSFTLYHSPIFRHPNRYLAHANSDLLFYVEDEYTRVPLLLPISVTVAYCRLILERMSLFANAYPGQSLLLRFRDSVLTPADGTRELVEVEGDEGDDVIRIVGGAPYSVPRIAIRRGEREIAREVRTRPADTTVRLLLREEGAGTAVLFGGHPLRAGQHLDVLIANPDEQIEIVPVAGDVKPCEDEELDELVDAFCYFYRGCSGYADGFAPKPMVAVAPSHAPAPVSPDPGLLELTATFVHWFNVAQQRPV
jgi:hypothetical protein